MANNSNGYVIPFGIDAKDFFSGLKQIDTSVDEMASNTKEATDSMTKGFQTTVAASDKLDKSMANNVSQASVLSQQAGKLGKELGNALGGKNVGDDLKNKLDSFTAAYSKLTNTAGKKLAFNIDTAKLKQFEKMLIDGQDELKVLAQVSAFAKDQLKELAPDSAEFKELNEQIQVADEFLKGLGETTEQVTTKNKTLIGQLREMKDNLVKLELAGKENTSEFKQLSQESAHLQDKITGVNERVKVLANNSRYIEAAVQAVSAVAGGFAVAEGATALFGSENEELAQTLKKVTGAMAILEGIQALATAFNKDSALSVLFLSKSQTENAAATGAAAAATTAEAGATVAATAATKSWTAALLTNPIFIIAAVIAAVVTALIAFGSSSNDAEDATKALNDEIERQNSLLKLNEGDIKRRTDLNAAIAKAAGKSESDISKIQYKGDAERLNAKIDAYSKLTDLYNDDFNRRNRSADDDKKLSQQLFDLDEEIQDQRTGLQIKGLEITKQISDEAKEISKKRIEDAKKAAEEEKKALEQRLKYIRELENATIAAMVDGYEKEKAIISQQFKEKIEDLEREINLSKGASKTKIALLKQLKANELKELAAIDKKEATEAATLAFESSKLQADLLKDGLAKELEQIHLNYTERRRAVREQFKNDEDERRKLFRLLNAAEEADKDKARKAAALTDLKAIEENEVLQIETASKFLAGMPKVEEQKQIDILKVKLKYAVKQKELLIAQGNAENSTVVLQAEKTVQELEKALGVALKDRQGKEGFSMFDFLGLGDLTEAQKNAVVDAAKQSLDSIRQITDFIVEQYQRQIDKKQEVIDQIDEDISDLESKLEDEKSLKEQGFSNNVDLIEKEIEEKKRQKEEEIKQQEELQRKQQAIAKAQLILDTAMQASNLITSATQIFKVLSGIPFIGIPLAIATIGLMTGAFVTAKIKAFQAVGDQKSFGDGGEIDGPSHAAGGVKYYANDGSGAVRELEGQEWVTKKSQAQKYKPLLRAINDDALAGMSDAELGHLLNGLGIHFDNSKGQEAIDYVHQKAEQQQILLMQPGNDIEQLESINENVAYLASKKKTEVERWEDATHFYEKTGQTIIKTAK